MYVWRRAKCCEEQERSVCTSALALLVAQVVADDHDPAVTADHLALVADLLDARLDLHGTEVLRVVLRSTRITCIGRRSVRASGHTETAPRRPCHPGGYGYSASASCR